MGRMPCAAMPTAAPMIAASERGVSITRSGPYFSKRFSVARKTPPRLPTSSPRTTMRSSLPISSSSVRAMVCTMFWVLNLLLLRAKSLLLLAQEVGDFGEDVLEHPLERHLARLLGLLLGGLLLLLNAGEELLLLLLVPQALVLEEAPVAGQGIALAPRLHLLLWTVTAVVVGGRVRTVAVDGRLDEGGAKAFAGPLDRLLQHVVAGEHIHAVDQVAGHAVGVGLHGDVLGGGLLVVVDGDGVAVVLHEEHDRGTLHAREVDARVEVALGGRAVTERAHGHLAGGLQLHADRRAHGRRHV